jgi:uncharacterized protein
VRKDDAIVALKAQAEAIKALGATALYLFGSTARDGAADSSDLDLSLSIMISTVISPSSN